MNENKQNTYIITAGSNYLDIDAYACAVAMAELLRLKGENAVAFSLAPFNYSVCNSLIEDAQIMRSLPDDISIESAKYIIVDVSDPEFLSESISLKQVAGVYDHHVGFESYWKDRIGEGANIEFIGAAATLIYREWQKAGLQDKISRPTTLLLIAAILDNTLNLTSTNTTAEDIFAFRSLCEKESVTSEWCVSYFLEVQKNIESDLKNAILKDIKFIRNNSILPARMAQICVWDAEDIISKAPQIRGLFYESLKMGDDWMINIIDISRCCSYFLCYSEAHQTKLEDVFDIAFVNGVAKTSKAYLRKEIIKKTISFKNT